MPQSIFIFDFGGDEDTAQQARHKVDAWKQGFRLGNKMLLKFERTDAAEEKAAEGGEETKASGKGKTAGKKTKSKKEDSEKNGKIRLLVRLDFSDHEKLTYQRWLDRIPAEEPFKSAESQTVKSGDPEFPKTAELFDSLD